MTPKKLRVYDSKGREHYVSLGDIVPAGWYEATNPPKRLEEDHIVVEKEYLGFDDIEPRKFLVLRPKRLEEIRPAVEAANKAGKEVAEYLNTRLEEAGIPREFAHAVWYIPRTVDDTPAVGKMVIKYTQLGWIGYREKEISSVEEFEELLPIILRNWQDHQEHLRQEEIRRQAEEKRREISAKATKLVAQAYQLGLLEEKGSLLAGQVSLYYKGELVGLKKYEPESWTDPDDGAIWDVTEPGYSPGRVVITSYGDDQKIISLLQPVVEQNQQGK